MRDTAMLIERLKEQRWEGAISVRESALKARDAAIADGSPLLEGEALLLLGRNFTPMVMPEETLKAMARARAIFVANSLPSCAAHSMVIAARALLDMGRNWDAIMCARSALSEHSLTHEHRAAALVIMALCHGQLGEIDIALRLLSTEAIPLLSTPGGALHRPQTLGAAAALKLRVLLAKQAPFSRRGIPDLPAVEAPPSHISEVLGLARAAGVALPPGKRSPIVEITEHVAVGLTEESEHPLEALRHLAASNEKSDPPSSCLALFGASVLLKDRQSFNEALIPLREALRLASLWKLNLVTNDALLQKARICEQLGDAVNSLRAYKAFWALRERNFHRAQLFDSELKPDALVDAALAHAANPRSLRSLRPACVRRAIAFIDQHLADKLMVSTIAEHCEVSRRTLEIAFKEAFSSGVAQYVKRSRLEYAAASLRNTSWSIKDVSRSVGYLSAAAFGRDFLAHFGAQPAKWRRQVPPGGSEMGGPDVRSRYPLASRSYR